MTFPQLQKELKQGNYAPVYMLMGEEPYFIDELTHYIEKHAISEADKAFNMTIVYGRDVSLDAVLSTAKGYPMMGERQVVIVKEAQDMKDWRSAEKLQQLEAYLNQPQPSTVLVFDYKKKSLDKRLKVTKLIKEKGVLFESKRMYDNQVPGWVESYLKDRKYQIEPSATRLIADYLGADLSKVANELNKLMVIVPSDQTITTTLIEQHIGISKDYNVFELQKALGTKDILKCNRIVKYFAANPKEHPIQMVLPSLYNYFSKILVYHTLPDKGRAASLLRVNPYFVKDYASAAQLFSKGKLVRIIGYIRECDRRSKGLENRSIDNFHLMKEMVFKMLH